MKFIRFGVWTVNTDYLIAIRNKDESDGQDVPDGSAKFCLRAGRWFTIMQPAADEFRAEMALVEPPRDHHKRPGSTGRSAG